MVVVVELTSSVESPFTFPSRALPPPDVGNFRHALLSQDYWTISRWVDSIERPICYLIAFIHFGSVVSASNETEIVDLYRRFLDRFIRTRNEIEERRKNLEHFDQEAGTSIGIFLPLLSGRETHGYDLFIRTVMSWPGHWIYSAVLEICKKGDTVHLKMLLDKLLLEIEVFWDRRWYHERWIMIALENNHEDLYEPLTRYFLSIGVRNIASPTGLLFNPALMDRYLKWSDRRSVNTPK